MQEPQPEQKATMKSDPTARDQSFRFYASNGKLLTEQIEALEAMATKSLKDGIAYYSVQTGCLALLKITMEGVSTKAD
jgi:hypothetical protein